MLILANTSPGVFERTLEALIITGQNSSQRVHLEPPVKKTRTSVSLSKTTLLKVLALRAKIFGLLG